jgi:hypothetical protein
MGVPFLLPKPYSIDDKDTERLRAKAVDGGYLTDCDGSTLDP